MKLSFTIYNSGLRFQKAKEYSEFITRLTYNCVHLRLNNKKKIRTNCPRMVARLNLDLDLDLDKK